MLKLLFTLTLFIYNVSLAGISESWLEHQKIDCKTNSIELTKQFQASPNETIHCHSFNPIAKGDLEKFVNSTDQVRVDLETWIYLQNSSKLILKESENKLEQYKEFQKEIENIQSDELNQIQKNYYILQSLYEKKQLLEKADSVCSKIRLSFIPVINMAERLMNDFDCEYVSSDQFEAELQATKDNIEEFETLNPLFLHPHFKDEFDQGKKSEFKDSMSTYLTVALPELEYKIERHNAIQKLPLNKDILEHLLDSKKFLTEVTALNYTPTSQNFRSQENGEYKHSSLHQAKCITHQKFLAKKSDDILADLATEVALGAAPFLIHSKINAALNGIKLAASFLKAKQTARGTLVASELTLAAADQKLMDNSMSECKELAVIISSQRNVSSIHEDKIKECHDLADTVATSKFLALIGGGVAIKLSKYDLQSMRLDRIYSKGRTLAGKTKSVVTASIVKQADIIKQQVEQMFPTPAMANIPINMTQADPSNIQMAEGSKLSGRLSLNRKNEPPGVTHLRKTVNEFDCLTSVLCKNAITRMRNDLVQLGKIQPDGLEKAHNILGLIRTGQFFKFPNSLQEIFYDCLNVLKCLPKEFDIVQRMGDLKLHTTPSKFFYKRILNMYRLDSSEELLKRNLTILNNLPLKEGAGNIFGNFNDIRRYQEYTLINGTKYKNTDNRLPVLIKSLKREDEAIKLLAKKGFKVHTIPETVEQRKAKKIQDKFEKIAKVENIGRDKNPDIILNDNYIADIYSPEFGLKESRINSIARGILSKVEGKDKYYNVKKYTNDENEYRQTNRVVVYVDQIRGNPQKLVNQLKRALTNEEPAHLQEAFLIYERGGKPITINIWP